MRNAIPLRKKPREPIASERFIRYNENARSRESGASNACRHSGKENGDKMDKLFVISDLHGFYTETIAALDACTARSGVVNVLVLHSDDRPRFAIGG